MSPSRFASATFAVDAADFDGANDYMLRGSGLTGAADSKTGIFSAWVRMDGGDGNLSMILDMALGQASFRRSSDNNFRATLCSDSGNIKLDIETRGEDYTASTAWRHMLVSWDLGTPGAMHMYINDVSDMFMSVFINDTIDYTVSNWAVGGSTSGASKLNGALAEMYFAPGQYLDFSVASNRRKFISTNGKPVSLGADGSTPTGVQPLVYLHLDDGDSASDFGVNLGSGGDFSVTGSLDTASSSPSD